jgi:hypothetical protein
MSKRIPQTPPPNVRMLRAFGYDPGLATELENYEVSEVLIPVRWEPDVERSDVGLENGAERRHEPGLLPGPVGDYLEIIDIDPASECVYPPVDLNAPHLLAQDGLTPSEGSPQFHQQMVYAVAMNTIQHFERALGRQIFWSDRKVKNAQNGKVKTKYLPTERLRIHPHVLREENAYYDSAKKALLFGYFPSRPIVEGEMPGGMIFSCLSHDIIAHETTHAILDGLQRYFLESSNTDELAFHEAIADLVALFQHFTYPDILRRQIAKARGRLDAETLLGQLAVQFGKAIGGHGALRDAIGAVDPATGKWKRGQPRPEDAATVVEPHARGALLVAAVFDAFLAIYDSRTRDLLRIATSGTGMLPPGDLHPDLVNRMAAEASKAAGHLLLMCIRAIDYCPPVDVTFGDFMRGLITADYDLVPNDTRNYRVAVIEAFRRWGIYPNDVRTLSEESLRWNPPSDDEPDVRFAELLRPAFFQDHFEKLWDEIANARIRPDGMRPQEKCRKLTRMEIYGRIQEFSEGLHASIKRGIAELRDKGVLGGEKRPFGLNIDYGHTDDQTFEVHQVRPVRRQGPDGRLQQDLLIQITQRRPGFFADETQKKENERYNTRKKSVARPSKGRDFWYRGGTTFILDLESFELRYAIQKDVVRTARLDRQRQFLMGLRGTTLSELYFGPPEPGLQLAALHAGED